VLSSSVRIAGTIEWVCDRILEFANRACVVQDDLRSAFESSCHIRLQSDHTLLRHSSADSPANGILLLNICLQNSDHPLKFDCLFLPQVLINYGEHGVIIVDN